MSGLEGLGIALGVLPLLVSAIEHYEDVFRPFHRYKDFMPQLARFQRQLLAQKTIFRSQCQLLLVPLTDIDTTADMLNVLGHSMWASTELAQKLKDHLGQSAEACVATMTEMEEQLQAIRDKGEEFIPTESTSKKVWRTHIKKKLKFSISEPHIDRCIGKLRDLNQDFSALASQTSTLLSVARSERFSAKSVPVIKQCQRIQQASVKFHEALGAACSSHNEHQAHLQVIQPSFTIPDDALEQSNVRFCVGLLSKSEGTRDSTPIWFIVRSIVESIPMPKEYLGEATANLEEVDKLALALKRNPSPAGGFDSKRPRKKKRRTKTTELTFPMTPSSTGANSFNTCAQLSPNHQPSSNKATSLPNFCIAQDLCVHLSGLCQRPFNGSGTCFGHLSKSSVTHELYLESQNDHAQGFVSLAELVGSMAARRNVDQLDRVPLLECVRLARNVALAVLQFHSTPFLKPSWSGNDIVFYGLALHTNPSQRNNVSAMAERIPDPYLRIKVNRKESYSTIIHQLSTNLEEKPIRNFYLFRLGVALLEIAYQAPLQSIRRRSGTNIQTEFEIADYFSRTVGSMLGPRYAKIVRKCLGCDFGHDIDLSCEELRVAVYKSVVLELEGLVQDFERKMDISE